MVGTPEDLNQGRLAKALENFGTLRKEKHE
jgi:hypothetical protein